MRDPAQQQMIETLCQPCVTSPSARSAKAERGPRRGPLGPSGNPPGDHDHLVANKTGEIYVDSDLYQHLMVQPDHHCGGMASARTATCASHFTASPYTSVPPCLSLSLSFFLPLSLPLSISRATPRHARRRVGRSQTQDPHTTPHTTTPCPRR